MIRLGTMNDYELLLGCLKEAAQRIKVTGSTQWSDLLEGQENEELSQRLLNRQVWIYEKEGRCAGMLYLYSEPTAWDKELWEDEEQPNFVYLHKLALGNGFTGQGLAESFIDLISDRMFREGKTIRLDCMADKEMLSALYERSGFKRVGTKEITYQTLKGLPFHLYEK